MSFTVRLFRQRFNQRPSIILSCYVSKVSQSWLQTTFPSIFRHILPEPFELANPSLPLTLKTTFLYLALSLSLELRAWFFILSSHLSTTHLCDRKSVLFPVVQGQHLSLPLRLSTFHRGILFSRCGLGSVCWQRAGPLSPMPPVHPLPPISCV